RCAALPHNGLWNTRPMNRARRCSGQRVTSWPSRWMLPESTKNVPAIAFSSVDFPEPFVPITITNEPSSMVRSTSCKDLTSLGVPALNVFTIFFVSSMGGGPRSRHAYSREQVRQDQCQEDKRSCD